MAIPAEEEWLGEDFVICQLVTDDDIIGISEVFVWLPETGVSPAQVIEVIQNYLSRYLLNEDPMNIEKINTRMDNNVARNEVAKGLPEEMMKLATEKTQEIQTAYELIKKSR